VIILETPEKEDEDLKHLPEWVRILKKAVRERKNGG
jgi:hypothetical protein